MGRLESSHRSSMRKDERKDESTTRFSKNEFGGAHNDTQMNAYATIVSICTSKTHQLTHTAHRVPYHASCVPSAKRVSLDSTAGCFPIASKAHATRTIRTPSTLLARRLLSRKPRCWRYLRSLSRSSQISMKQC